jgi:metal-responsive CopG/Arc/MetJ family transcriptional regulator
MPKVIISISEPLLTVVDKYCDQYKYNRSEFFRHAVRMVMKEVEKDDDTKRIFREDKEK